jgi:hypothetical protein
VGDGGNDKSLSTTGSGLLNAFTAGGEAQTRRFEGALPPGYPEDVPVYASATLVSSVLQVSDPNAGFIVVHHSDDDRDVVAGNLLAAYSAGSWQVDGGQENRDATLLQFSKVDDATVSGIVLLTESKDGQRTTIITSIQDTDGASAIDDEAFTEPSRARNSPPGFPSEVSSYEGALLIESAYQKEAQGNSFALSYITRDEADVVEEFYRNALEQAGLTVEDGDASASPLDDARVLAFANDDSTLQGEVAIGGFAEDEAFTRIDVQVGDERDNSGDSGSDGKD